MKREAGILLSISSLPSHYGIGCFSKEAYRFVDWLEAAGQSYWQILPMGPTGYGDSPYQSFSTFAGNPYFIDLEALCKKGLLTKEECDAAELEGDPGDINYGDLYNRRIPLLHTAFERSSHKKSAEYLEFLQANEDWLPDYTLFMALKDANDGAAWTSWPNELKIRNPEAISEAKERLARQIDFYAFLQYEFLAEWGRLHNYAAAHGISIIGDIPIYVSLDSADVWASPELFQLDENNVPKQIAGCPPDGFSAIGQVWGNPLYDWPYHEKTGYEWWIRRLLNCFRLYDSVRIDHFRGFDEYYAIPFGEDTAINGHWEKGPGMSLFRTVLEKLGPRDIIAEDLGYVTDSVRKLVKDTGFKNMKVLEFAFDSRDTGSAADYLPHNYGTNCVAYTGTHDNETIRGWFGSITDEERAAVRTYLCDKCTPDSQLYLPMIALILRSTASLAVIPIQDWLGLGNEARMNRPSSIGTNWRWRVPGEALSEELADMIRTETESFGRA
ncbi:MAG: 4-alpha-glucanotransferase [Eubacteriales bacterium]|nr:4-alpha-glucanotransferase [Eubacteriales bacterium]